MRVTTRVSSNFPEANKMCSIKQGLHHNLVSRPKELARGPRVTSSHFPEEIRRRPSVSLLSSDKSPGPYSSSSFPFPSPSPERKASLASAFSRNPKKNPASSPRPRSRTPLDGGKGYVVAARHGCVPEAAGRAHGRKPQRRRRGGEPQLLRPRRLPPLPRGPLPP